MKLRLIEANNKVDHVKFANFEEDDLFNKINDFLGIQGLEFKFDWQMSNSPYETEIYYRSKNFNNYIGALSNPEFKFKPYISVIFTGEDVSLDNEQRFKFKADIKWCLNTKDLGTIIATAEHDSYRSNSWTIISV